MVNVVSRTFPLDLMMKFVHFQVKKRLSFELQNVTVWLSSAVGLSTYPPLSAASARLAQRRIWQSINIKVAR